MRSLSLLALPLLTLSPVAAAQAQTVMPGEWETRSTVTAADMPGMPAGMAAAMKGRTTVVRHCVTPADAAKGPRQAMKTSKDCHFDHFSMIGGRVDSKMVCTSNGTTTTIISSGRFTPSAYDMRGTMTMAGPRRMSMSTAISGRRTGPCPASR